MINDARIILKSTSIGDKSFYDEEGEYSDEALSHFVKKQDVYIDRYRKLLLEYFGCRPLHILELGAGTCTLSLSLSKSLIIKHGVAFDISATRMQRYAPRVRKILEIESSVLKYVEGNFSDLSCLIGERFDLILFDASLHHARSIWDLLSSCRELLSKGGLLVAQREQYLARLSAGWAIKRLMGTDEVRSGVSENAYLREQYLYYLRVCGFDPCTIAAPETRFQKLFFFLNGFIYSKWVLIARGSDEKIGNELTHNLVMKR